MDQQLPAALAGRVPVIQGEQIVSHIQVDPGRLPYLVKALLGGGLKVPVVFICENNRNNADDNGRTGIQLKTSGK